MILGCLLTSTIRPIQAFLKSFKKERENIMKLKDTAQLMTGSYRERFLAEYRQAVIRRDELTKMLENWDELPVVPACPKSTYALQASVMTEYIAVLEARAAIEGFWSDAEKAHPEETQPEEETWLDTLAMIAEELGWRVTVDDEKYVLFERTTPCGVPFSFGVTALSPKDVITGVSRAFATFDTCCETYALLDKRGHGTGTAPYDMRDVYDAVKSHELALKTLRDRLANALDEIER